jgi:hypothetical protein
VRGRGGTMALAVGLGLIAAPAIAMATPIVARAAPAWSAGAAAEKITPLPYNAADDAVNFPICNTTTVYTGQRLFDFEEPYIDQAGTGLFQYPDPYCDANTNNRWDGLYTSGGVARLTTWVHDDIWVRALAMSDGAHTVVVESVTSQGLMIEDIQRIRSGLSGYTGVTGTEPPVGQTFVSSNHNESSPDPIGIYGAPADPTGTVGVHSGIDDYYITFLVQQAVKAGKEAVDALAPAVVRVGDFSPPDVRARLSTSFLTTDSNPTVTTGPTADGTAEATDTKAVVLQLRNAQTGANIETLLNWAAHNQQTGHAPGDSMAPDPNDANRLKPINESVSDDWPGVFASTVEAQLGGHAMFLVGDNGSIEDPHVYPLPNPDTECPPTDFNPVRSQGTAEGCVTLPHLTGTRLANDVLNIVGLAPTLANLEDVAPTGISWATSQFDVPLQNQLFIAAFGAGIFAHRTASTVSPCIDAENTARTCFLTEVGLLDLGPQLEMLAAPGEAYPALIEGHPFGMEQISCPERAEPPVADWHATAAHKLQMGLGDDMLGYMIPAPGWFADSAVFADPGCPPGAQAQSNPSADYDQYNNYHKLESESVGPDTGNDVATQLAKLADCAAAGTLQTCAATPSLCQNGSRTIESGRFLLADGTFTRKGKDGPVGMWLLPCGITTFTPGTGTLIALPGISGFGSTPVNATGTFVDFDGRTQTVPDINTRGMLVSGGGGSGTTYYFMDPYTPLAGTSPGAAQQAPQVPETPFPALGMILVLAVVGLVRILRPERS